ncbi:hypothetical protein ABPG72_020429 [Tetrahymena utriculariae]
MANIHRIGDYENQNNGNYNRFGGGDMQQDMQRLRAMNIPLMNLDDSYPISPRKESFWDMLKINFCPRLKLISFTVFISIVNIIIFIITSAQGIQTTDGSLLLQQKPQVLIDFGANYPTKIKHNGQVWRLVTAIFLHGSFYHIFFNTLSTFIFVSSIERSYGVIVTFIVWIISGIGGNIFSADFAQPNSISVGASTAIMGMIGLYIAFLILNWKTLEFMQQLRCCLVLFAFLMVAMIFLLGASMGYGTTPGYSQNIDNYGHLGGMITGILAGVVIPKPIYSGSYEKNAKIICGSLLALYTLLTFIMFFTVTDV